MLFFRDASFQLLILICMMKLNINTDYTVYDAILPVYLIG